MSATILFALDVLMIVFVLIAIIKDKKNADSLHWKIIALILILRIILKDIPVLFLN